MASYWKVNGAKTFLSSTKLRSGYICSQRKLLVHWCLIIYHSYTQCVSGVNLPSGDIHPMPFLVLGPLYYDDLGILSGKSQLGWSSGVGVLPEISLLYRLFSTGYQNQKLESRNCHQLPDSLSAEEGVVLVCFAFGWCTGVEEVSLEIAVSSLDVQTSVLSGDLLGTDRMVSALATLFCLFERCGFAVRSLLETEDLSWDHYV